MGSLVASQRRSGLVALPCVLLAFLGCSAGQGPATADASLTRPEAVANARVVTGRVVCRLEVINGNSIRESHAFRSGSRATLVGWSTVADRLQSLPPLTYVVFRSAVPDGSQDRFWAGERVARPDLSRTDPRLAHAGYAATGRFPDNPGRYKVLLWAGDGRVQRECDTGEVLELNG